MAERKFFKSEELANSKTEKSESPADFLARTGVTRQLLEVISILLENKPENPVAFISDYFTNLAEHVSSVNQAYQCLCLSHHSKPAYDSNLFKAYSILIKQKCGQGLKGLIGKSYNELLAMLCRDIESNESETLLKLLQKNEKEVVSFNAFRIGATCFFLFKDFLSQAKSLFEELDMSGRGQVDFCLCEEILSQLTSTIQRTNNNCQSILEAGVSLNACQVDAMMKKALSDTFSRNNGKTMTMEEFLQESCAVFFFKVPQA